MEYLFAIMLGLIVVGLAVQIELIYRLRRFSKEVQRLQDHAERSEAGLVRLVEWLANNLKAYGDFSEHNNIIQFKPRGK